MRFDGFTEADYEDDTTSIFLFGDLDMESIRRRRTRDFRIDPYPCKFNSGRIKDKQLDREKRCVIVMFLKIKVRIGKMR